MSYSQGVPLGKRQRRLLLGSGLTLVALIGLWLALPLWFPWLIRPLAATQGIHYASCIREDYSHFKLTGVTLTNRTVRFSADTFVGLVPSVWLWRLATQNSSEAEPFVLLSGWHFVSAPSGKPSAPVYSDARLAESLLARLKRWMPVAGLTNGTVHRPDFTVSVPILNWNRGTLSGSATLPPPMGPVTFRAALADSQVIQFEAISDPLHLRASARLVTVSGELELQSKAFWWSNQVDLRARFSPISQVPESASLAAAGFVIPSQIVDVSPYQDLKGSLRGAWEQSGFSLDLNLATESPPTQTNLPPLRLALQARGNTNSVNIETAHLSAPFLVASLSRQLVLNFHGPLLPEPARLKLAADLSRQAWLPLRGELRGGADFSPSGSQFPRAIFQLSGTEIGHETVTASAAHIAGSFDWPHLLLTNVLAEFADGSRAVGSADLGLTQRTVSNGEVHFTGPLARRWLPSSYSYGGLDVTFHCDGPLDNLAHRGNAKLSEFSTPFLRPTELNVTWIGQRQTLPEFAVELSAGDSRLEARGALTNRPGELNVQLNTLSLLTNRQALLNLTRPLQLTLRRDAPGDFQLSSSQLDWAGRGGELRANAFLDWPLTGDVSLSIERASSSLVRGFAKDDWPLIEIGKLSAAANWSNTPVSFDLEVSGATVTPSQGSPQVSQPFLVGPVVAELQLRGTAEGLAISNLIVYSRTSAVLTAQGFLPVTLTPASGTNFIQVEPHEPIQIVAAAHPHALFWNEFSRWTGVNLQNPQLKLEISGDWENPRGEVDFSTAEVSLQKTSATVPRLSDLSFRVQLDGTEARVSEAHLLVQGQPVTLTAEIPLGRDFIHDLKLKRLPDWNRANARLRIQDAELAAFEPLFPNILAPQGTLNLDLSLAPGGKLAGELALQGGRTRPLGDFGPIRDINMKCRFRDRLLSIENVSAQISGAPLNIAGETDLSGTQWLHGQVPPFTLRLQGTNVPLVRQPEAVIRSDLALVITKTNGAPSLIAGAVHLHDSFFLADLAELIPGKIESPKRRPPYFSIEDPFLADWRLGVKVEGVRFLKVRTPLFNGQVSADLTVQGTLKDPISLGDLKIDSGVVSFPFASLQVQQGLVSLGSQDPYHPQLTLAAASKQFGYDIHMDVSGPVDAPVIQFNSTPPLSSEQILLMVTAGQLPQGTFTLTAQQRAQTMAMFLGRDLLAKIGVGDQSQERLVIHSGEQITEQGRPTYQVEYKLSDRWSLVGEYDRFGDYNAGFKWRILSR